MPKKKKAVRDSTKTAFACIAKITEKQTRTELNIDTNAAALRGPGAGG